MRSKFVWYESGTKQSYNNPIQDGAPTGFSPVTCKTFQNFPKTF